MKIKITFIILLCSNFIVSSDEQRTKDDSITIFVHGTYLMKKLLQIFPYRKLIYCPEGLTLVKYLPEHYHFHKIAQGCVECDPENYSMDQFYVFGWKSEYVSDNIRNKSAEILVEQLYELIVEYYMHYKVIPKIRLIGYSHGGNVILHAAQYLPLYADLQDMEVEAWLFGTPVQVATHDFVNSDCFTYIYSIYSIKDVIQTIDPQGWGNKELAKTHFWSEQTFCQNSRCIQVEFTVNGNSITHGFYNSIFKYFPKIKKLIEQASQDCLESRMIAVDFTI